MNSRMANITTITITGEKSKPDTARIIPEVAPGNASTWEKVDEATTISRIMVVTWTVPYRDLAMAWKVRPPKK